jgi:hypothetical protein
MKILSKLAAASITMIALAGQPAIAGKARDNATSTVAAKDAGTGSVRKVREKKYCADTEATGSRVPQRLCMTESMWKSQGVDITAFLK